MTVSVCHLISGDLWAGAEVMASHLLRRLHRRSDIGLFVILLNRGRLSEELEGAGIPTCVIDEQQRSFAGILRSAAREIAARRPDVLHSHRYKENALAYLVSKILHMRVALVATQHGMPEHELGLRGAVRSLKSRANLRLMASRFTTTVAVSDDIKASLVREHGFRDGSVEVIHNGIGVASQRHHPVSGATFKVGSAGRLVPVKDYSLFVEVAHHLIRLGCNIQFELAGEGPMREEIQRRVVRCGLSGQFSLLGFVADIDAFYEGLDVYVNTSRHEGIPMSVLEAMARGIPVVVPGVGGLGEIVTDGVDGFVVRDRNPEGFAQKCRALYEDGPLREAMSEAAQKTINDRFSVENMVASYVDLYARAAAL